MKNKQVLLFLPVLHAGYVAFLGKHKDADEVLLLGEGFGEVFPAMTKEIRALTPSMAAVHAQLVVPNTPVRVVEPTSVALAIDCRALVVPDEQLMRDIVDAFHLGIGRKILWERTFLRWDREWSRPQPVGDLEPASGLTDEDRALMARARALSGRSSDWWRQVGAVMRLPDGTVLEAHNRHHPTEYAPYLDGDPRNEFHRGERTDLSTAIHAEASLIAQAARSGTSVRGGMLFVTTFPCPSCARLISEAGIAACFFEAPYAVLAGDHILKSAGVRLHWVPNPEGLSVEIAPDLRRKNSD